MHRRARCRARRASVWRRRPPSPRADTDDDQLLGLRARSRSRIHASGSVASSGYSRSLLPGDERRLAVDVGDHAEHHEHRDAHRLGDELVDVLLERAAIGADALAGDRAEPADLPARAGREQRLADLAERVDRRRVERADADARHARRPATRRLRATGRHRGPGCYANQASTRSAIGPGASRWRK